VEVYSIGFTKKTAEQFFGLLRKAGIRRLIDIRLNNSSQLAAFTKKEDLPFFLREICDAEYVHMPELAPTQAILDAYKKEKGSWSDYERAFLHLLKQRRIEAELDRGIFAVPAVLLCSEPTPERCHRRLVLEYLAERWGGMAIRHL
jgi:uncharacterized protein (DUF488 family)